MEGARLLVRVNCKRVMDLPRVRVWTLNNTKVPDVVNKIHT